MAVHPEMPSEMSLTMFSPRCRGPRKSDCSSSENYFSECLVRMHQKLSQPSSKARLLATATHKRKSSQSASIEAQNRPMGHREYKLCLSAFVHVMLGSFILRRFPKF